MTNIPAVRLLPLCALSCTVYYRSRAKFTKHFRTILWQKSYDHFLRVLWHSKFL